jgi:hypothetical protein
MENFLVATLKISTLVATKQKNSALGFVGIYYNTNQCSAMTSSTLIFGADFKVKLVDFGANGVWEVTKNMK